MPRVAATRRAVLVLALALAAPGASLAAQEQVYVATIEGIMSEAMDRPQVMDIMSWTTDVYGPRLA